MRAEAASRQELRPKQQRFIEEYLVDLNGKQAAIRAGYAAGSAHVTASRLLNRPSVRASVASTIGDRFGVTRWTIVEELAAIAFHNIAEYMDWSDGSVTVVPSLMLTETQLKAVASARLTGSGCTELKFHDKLKALELLSRALGYVVPEDPPVPTGKVKVLFEP